MFFFKTVYRNGTFEGHHILQLLVCNYTNTGDAGKTQDKLFERLEVIKIFSHHITLSNGQCAKNLGPGVLRLFS
jgi:hypothetical protein